MTQPARTRPAAVRAVRLVCGCLVRGDWGRSLAKEPVLGAIRPGSRPRWSWSFWRCLSPSRSARTSVSSRLPQGRSSRPRRLRPRSGSRCRPSGSGCCCGVFFGEWLHLFPATGRSPREVEFSTRSRRSRASTSSTPSSPATGWASLRREPPRAADVDARRVPGRGDHANDPRSHARRPRSGLRPGRPRVRRRGAGRPLAPRSSERAAADDDSVGLSCRVRRDGRVLRRGRLQLAGVSGSTRRTRCCLDYPAIMGVTVLGATSFVLVNLVVDVVHARLDPRVRSMTSSSTPRSRFPTRSVDRVAVRLAAQPARDSGALLGAIVVTLLVFVAFAHLSGAVSLAGAGSGERCRPRPGAELAHRLGTDQLGRDVLTRVIFGGRPALGVPSSWSRSPC